MSEGTELCVWERGQRGGGKVEMEREGMTHLEEEVGEEDVEEDEPEEVA